MSGWRRGVKQQVTSVDFKADWQNENINRKTLDVT